MSKQSTIQGRMTGDKQEVIIDVTACPIPLKEFAAAVKQNEIIMRDWRLATLPHEILRTRGYFNPILVSTRPAEIDSTDSQLKEAALHWAERSRKLTSMRITAAQCLEIKPSGRLAIRSDLIEKGYDDESLMRESALLTQWLIASLPREEALKDYCVAPYGPLPPL